MTAPLNVTAPENVPPVAGTVFELENVPNASVCNVSPTSAPAINTTVVPFEAVTSVPTTSLIPFK